jgi:hypothetical protein
MDDARLGRGQRPPVPDDLGQALEPVADQEEHVPGSPVPDVGQHGHPELRALTAGPGPQPEDVLLAIEEDSDRGIDRPVRDLPVPLVTGPLFSWPRRSVISWFSAVSSTVLVSCFSSPPGPVSDRPCSFARATSSSASFSSAVGSRFVLFVTSSSVAFITAPLPPNLRFSDQGRKHRC